MTWPSGRKFWTHPLNFWWVGGEGKTDRRSIELDLKRSYGSWYGRFFGRTLETEMIDSWNPCLSEVA